MLRACKYCGRIHDSKFDCGKKPKKSKRTEEKTDEARFRSSTAWRVKSIEIRSRDHYLCQACLRNLPGTLNRLNSANISVHHAEPLRDAWDLRLDDRNLITLYEMHHEMAEAGELPYDIIRMIIDEQEDRRENEENMPPGG